MSVFLFPLFFVCVQILLLSKVLVLLLQYVYICMYYYLCLKFLIFFCVTVLSEAWGSVNLMKCG